MSDNQKVPDDILLGEGESHEFLPSPESPLELNAPEEVMLLDSGDDIIVSPQETPIVVSEEDTQDIVIEKLDQEEPVDIHISPEVSLLDAMDIPVASTEVLSSGEEALLDESVIESAGVSETDPALFDAIVPEELPVQAVMDEVIDFSHIADEASPTDKPMISDEPIISEVSEGVLTDEPIQTEPTPEISVVPPMPVISETSTPVAASIPLTETPTITITQAPIAHTSHIALIAGGIALFSAIGVGAWFMLSSDEDAKPKTNIEYTISAEQEPEETYEAIVEQQIVETADNAELMNQAFAENDSTLCNKISLPDMQSQCRESLLARELAQSGSLEDCQALTIESIKTNCTTTIQQNTAIASMNKTLCADIVDPSQSQYCRESIDEKILVSLVETKTATEAGCKQLEEKYQSTCIATIVRNDDNAILNTAVEKDDLDACNNLSDEELKFVCFDTILLKRALVSKDKNLCDYVKDETKKATCISYASAQDDNTTFKNAIIEKNLPLCSTIGNTTLKNRCHDSVTLLIVRDTKNPTLCDTLVATGTIDSCKKSAGVQ